MLGRLSLHQHFLFPFLHLRTETQGTKSAGTVADGPGKPQVCRLLRWPHRGWRDKVTSPGPVVQRTPASIPRRNKKAPPLAPKARYSILRWCTDGWKPQQWTRSSAEGWSKDSIRKFPLYSFSHLTLPAFPTRRTGWHVLNYIKEVMSVCQTFWVQEDNIHFPIQTELILFL